MDKPTSASAALHVALDVLAQGGTYFSEAFRQAKARARR